MNMLATVNALFNNLRLRKLLLRLRLPLGLVAAVALVGFIRPEWFWPGLAVSAFGAVFQWWCFSCIMTSKELALRGPYMLMRNPMYVARLFLVLGVCLMTGSWLFVGAMAVLYYFYMVNRVRREEVKLGELFGADYAAYCRDVRRFWPTFKRFDRRGFLHAELRCFRRNRGFRNLVVVLCAYAFLYWWVMIRPAAGG